MLEEVDVVVILNMVEYFGLAELWPFIDDWFDFARERRVRDSTNIS